MLEHAQESPVPPPPVPAPVPGQPRKRGRPVLAWVALAVLVPVPVVLHVVRPSPEGRAAEDRVGLVTMQVQGRYALGATHVSGLSGQTFYEQLRPLNTGPVGQRLRFVVLAGELAGPQEALNRLSDLDAKLAEHDIRPDPRQAAAEAALKRLYRREARRRSALMAVGAGAVGLLAPPSGQIPLLAATAAVAERAGRPAGP